MCTYVLLIISPNPIVLLFYTITTVFLMSVFVVQSLIVFVVSTRGSFRMTPGANNEKSLVLMWWPQPLGPEFDHLGSPRHICFVQQCVYNMPVTFSVSKINFLVLVLVIYKVCRMKLIFDVLSQMTSVVTLIFIRVGLTLKLLSGVRCIILVSDTLWKNVYCGYGYLF